MPELKSTQNSDFLCALGHSVHRLAGWRVEGELPKLPKYVVIAAHHTSNWDFVFGMAAKFILKIEASWFAKDSLFQVPLMGRLFKRWGGVEIDRRQTNGVVDQAIETFAKREHFVLAITPDGTRKAIKRWKLGFYHIAKGAEVPVVPVALDYAQKRIVIGEPIYASGSEAEDVQRIFDFFKPYPGKFPERAWVGPRGTPDA